MIPLKEQRAQWVSPTSPLSSRLTEASLTHLYCWTEAAIEQIVQCMQRKRFLDLGIRA